MKKARCLIVTGMHKSGASVVAHTLSALGISMGVEQADIAKINQGGQFGDPRVTEVHDALLVELGRPWGTAEHAIPFAQGWERTSAAQDAMEKMASYLENRAKEDVYFAFKDPRASLFLPLWIAVCRAQNFDLQTIICVRPYSEVAASLSRRCAIDPALSAQLWLSYNASAILHAPPRSTMLMFNEDWFSEAQLNTSRLASFTQTGDASSVCVFNPALQSRGSETSQGLVGKWEAAFAKTADSERKITPRLRALATQWHETAEVIGAPAMGAIAPQQDRLGRDIESYRNAHAVLEKRLSDMDHTAPDELAAARQSLAHTVEISNNIQRELSALSTSYRELQVERDTLLARAVASVEAHQTLDARNSAANEEIENLRGRNTELDHSIAEQSAAHRSQTQATEQLLTRMRQERMHLETNWREEKAGYETTVQVLSTDIGLLRTENEALQKRAEEYREALSTIQIALDGLKRDNARFARWHLPSQLRRMTGGS